MDRRLFSLAEAEAMLAEGREALAEIVILRRQLAEAVAALEERGERGALPEAKGLEARIGDRLDWFTSRGVQVKGWAPLLLDWPAEVGGRPVLLCWLENEERIGWYHEPNLGFPGRRPLAELLDPASGGGSTPTDQR
ncbi:DUF2203 domain-containing protein [Rhabdothermincola sp.]|uniref:DUF2203 domain-containing protein n=1 Tax=Rhabdothermincola sp. TaxID=2820405 RepID=UPI002FE39780